MANSNLEYGKPIRWGNVKKIEVERKVFESLFYQLQRIENELEHLRVEKSNEIRQLKSDIANLKRKSRK